MEAAITEFVAAFAEALRAQRTGRPDHAGELDRFLIHFDGFDAAGVPARNARRRATHPALVHLGAAFAAAPGRGQDRLAAAAEAVEPLLDWSLAYAKEGWSAAIADHMVASEVVGPWGLAVAEDFITGLFLLAPGIDYPPHGHAAWEVYYILSGRVEFQQGAGAPWIGRGPGQIALTASHQLHALRTGAEPALVLFAWRGEISALPWYPEPGSDGRRRATSGPDLP